MRPGFDKWWLLPLGVLAASVLLAFSIGVFGSSFVGRSSAEVAQRTASEAAVNCSGASSIDYACYQQRYRDLVRDSGVEAALSELEDESKENGFVRSNCHQLAHVIGRAADHYDDVGSTYGKDDDFCLAGYHHGAMEAFVAEIGVDQILEEADTLCADLRENQKHSVHHHNCAHGLGHGLMGLYENELFESLYACDALTDGWERDQCYGGVFMENLMARHDPNHPPKYLEADRPLYPCTEVEARYKTQCYAYQTQYALKSQDNDFAKVFDLCVKAEADSRPTCYQGLGRKAAEDGIRNGLTDAAKIHFTNKQCALGEDDEARSNCVIGAVNQFVLHYYSDAEAKAFCESFDDADLRAVCLQAGEDYYQRFQP